VISALRILSSKGEKSGFRKGFEIELSLKFEEHISIII